MKIFKKCDIPNCRHRAYVRTLDDGSKPILCIDHFLKVPSSHPLYNGAGGIYTPPEGFEEDINDQSNNNKSSHYLYSTYINMLDRCNNRANDAYRYYGEKGIKVCKRWSGEEGFQNFIADMGDRPLGMSIDRINNDWGYNPLNCRWATIHEQAGNRRDNKEIVGVDIHIGKKRISYTAHLTIRGYRYCKTFTNMHQATKYRKWLELLLLGKYIINPKKLFAQRIKGYINTATTNSKYKYWSFKKGIETWENRQIF